MQKQISITLEMEVPFFDVDSYRIAWHGSYVKYFEIARCKLLEHIGYTYADMEASGYFFPIIDMQVKYIKPLRFEQKFSMTATLVEWEHRLSIRYEITDLVSGERITKAKTSQVAVAMPNYITQFVSPDILLDKVNKVLQQ
ncbi:MAG: acyl-CoA thioesterase [Arenicella sp.]